MSNVKAQTVITSCGYYPGGVYVLGNDLYSEFSNCLVFDGPTVLDCQGHKIYGEGGFAIVRYNPEFPPDCREMCHPGWNGVGMFCPVECVAQSTPETPPYCRGNPNCDYCIENRPGDPIECNDNFIMAELTVELKNCIIENKGSFYSYLGNVDVKNSTFRNFMQIFYFISGSLKVFNSTFENYELSTYWGNVNITYNYFLGNHLWLDFTSGVVYNNYFKDTEFWCIGPPSFNITRQPGTRIYSLGPEIGGNYWTNSEGTGYSDTCTDADRDGFCDEPYSSCGIDYLPLSDEYSPGILTLTVNSPLNQTYYGNISFEFFAISNYETFTLKAYLNDELIYENESYQNNTLVEFSRLLLPGTYNFTVYAEVEGITNSTEVFFTSLGYCDDNVCVPEYEDPLNCFKDCGGTGEKSMISMVVIGLGISAFILGIGVIDIRRLGLEKLDPEAMAKISIGILIFLAIMFYIITNYLR